MHSLYRVNNEALYDDVVGDAGASRARVEHWRAQARERLPELLKNPQREAAPMLALPARQDDLSVIEETAKRLRAQFTDLVVIGMGGSSMSAQALSYLSKNSAMRLHIVDNIDPHSIATLVEQLPWKNSAFIVISKSGNTVETHAQLAVFLREGKQRLAGDYAKHFTVITILNNNPLHKLAVAHGFQLVPHDADLGGRFSILSVVGLIPAAAMGVDIRALRAGAQQVMEAHRHDALADAGEAAVLHLALGEKHAHMQVLMHYSDRLQGLAAWHRQCWSESLGKTGKGTTPIASRGATDQHSQLQLYLEGPNDKYFTGLIVESQGQGAAIDFGEDAAAELRYLAGHTLGDLLAAEQRATHATLIKAGRPLRTITCARFDEATMGALLMHFMLEVAFAAALMGVNAYDQPAVEAGKKLALDYLRA